jgi:predicted Zn-dependent protease
MRRAVTAEPTNATYRAQLGFANYSFQRPERGIAAMRRALAMDSSLEWVRISLARLYVMDGKLDRARRYVEAMLVTDSASARIARGDQGFEPYMNLAYMAWIRGDRDANLRELQAAYDHGYRQFDVLARNPTSDGIRDDPRFVRLRKRADADLDRMWREAQSQGP